MKNAALALCFLALFAIAAKAATIDHEKRDFIDSAKSVFGAVTADFGGFTSSLASEINDIKSVGTEIESIAGGAVTVLTADSGALITLATDGKGLVTEIAGAEYTVATSAFASAVNGASGAVSKPLFSILTVALVCLACGIVLG